MDLDRFRYKKNEVLHYVCKLWDSQIKENIQDILIDDPFNVEPLHEEEELQKYVRTVNVVKAPLFHRDDRRIDNTNLADFLHRRCLRFQDFAFSVLKADKTKEVPLCLDCLTLPDSPCHKIFECINNIASTPRGFLTDNLHHLETNFHLIVIFGLREPDLETCTLREIEQFDPETINDIRRELKLIIKYICKNSNFGDTLLTRDESD